MNAIMLNRLIGLETEYATIVRLPMDQAEAPSRRVLYEAICEEISKRMPTARGRYDADAIFLANGGAFSMETSPLRAELPGGLIEGATAEARSPTTLVQCQRAQDRLIADAAKTCEIPAQITIVKNSCDAHGHVYGCQENYSAPVASGIMLLVYWISMGLVMIPACFYWAACIALLAVEMAVLVVVRLPARFWASRLGREIDTEPVGLMDPLPPKMLAATALALRLISMPAAGALYLVARLIAFRKQRKYLTSFLVSRIVLTGAGHIDGCNRFRLSGKAMAVDTVTGFGGYLGERPIFVFHHWLQQLCGRSLLSSRSIIEFFQRSQRLQIGLSDSNVSDTAEYLKVATTSLVLDMIEAGSGRDLPRLKRPIESLHRISSDWNLITRVETTKGDMSGLDLQRAYFRACRRFVTSNPPPAGDEAYEVLRRWEEALESLSAFRSSEKCFLPGLGHVDWLTKKWMLDRIEEHAAPQSPREDSAASKTAQGDAAQEDAVRGETADRKSIKLGAANGGPVAPPATAGPSPKASAGPGSLRWAARKKVDIRYHELSDDGYFNRLKCIAPQVCSVNQAGIDMALRLPPFGSPALRRGHLIREFSDGLETVEVDWSHVVIGTGKSRRILSTS